ncbi:uncharacterized protein EV420DRAFT_1649966 [Desarmillaria tabescens]|uniref:Uncharacterized protein n=1 Tax=Armillaria tabescens TaxID=1929756 RepID=A0AA39JH90_ARMTA|nr:uncharacterized protein EV420DRAFT_1649966 [Desarmillaria tabescens]KAK0441731.1 hypothetical protein EV420DRAFT_1649966 [Desarmillaria tabescens]
MSASSEIPVDLAALVAKANNAMRFCDQLFELGVDVGKQLEQCKKLFGFGVEITWSPGHVFGNKGLEDLLFHLKQVFERLQKAHLGTQPFGDYHIVRAFTGQIHADHECRAQLSNPVLAAKAKANAATGQAAASSAADGSSAKPLSMKGKAKATTAKKGRKPPKSKAIVEDSSDDEPPALVAIEEDTVMGNADTPCTILDTDTVSISFLAAIACTADEVIARLQQMSIDDEVEIMVNKDPSSGNIIEGRKVLPKFKKNKVKEDAKHQQPKRAEVIFLPYAEVPGMDLTSKDYRRAEAVVAKAAAHDAATQARKRPRASNDFAFNDSAYSMAAAELALNNESTQETLAIAAKLIAEGGSVNPSETVLRSREADLRNDIIATVHRIEYLIQYCQFVVNHHGQVIKALERRAAAKDDACEHCTDNDVSDCLSTTATGYRSE